MIANFIKIAVRHLLRQKHFTLINIGGLAAGLACSLLIFLFARQELSYDSFHTRADHLYRLIYDETEKRPQEGRLLATTSPPMGPALVQSFPEIERMVRLRFSDGDVLGHGERQFHENGLVYADSTFLQLFSFSLAYGDPATALAAPRSVVLTPAMARKYFDDANPVGQMLDLNGEFQLQVTGVLQEAPVLTHLDFDFLVSFSTFRVPTGYPVTLESWGWISFHTYLLLRQGTDAAVLARKLPGFIERHFPERAGRFDLRLQPITDIYLGAPDHPDVLGGNATLPYGLLLVGALILTLASVNYVNLATARALTRAREVGLRKVVGATRRSLMVQFIGESVLLTLISFAVALALIELGWNLISDVLAVRLIAGTSVYVALLPAGVLLSLLIGVVAGSYPAFIAANFRPVRVLKGEIPGGGRQSRMRQVLVAGQFCITTALILATLVVARQMEFIRHKNLGFEREQVVVLHMLRDGSSSSYSLLRQRLLQQAQVVNVSASGGLLDGNNGSVPFFPDGAEQGIPVNIYGVRHHFFELLGIDVIEGRVFDEAYPADQTEAVVINKRLAAMLDWQQPVGRQVRVSNLVDGHIIGVVDDFHFASLHHEVGPLAVFVTDLVENVYVKVRPGTVPATLAALEAAWQEAVPGQPFHFTFLDEHIARLYARDVQFSRLILAFSLIAIVIACLGLYGLVAYSVRQRTREIGIRKILGATVPGIALELLRHLLLLLGMAAVLAWPVAYLALQRWLAGFAYHIEFAWWMFVLAGGLALAIAVFTASTQALRAALANPVDALRQE